MTGSSSAVTSPFALEAMLLVNPGQPLLEALHAEIDFGHSRVRTLRQETWRDIPRGRQGAMLLRLAEGVTRRDEFFPASF